MPVPLPEPASPDPLVPLLPVPVLAPVPPVLPDEPPVLAPVPPVLAPVPPVLPPLPPRPLSSSSPQPIAATLKQSTRDNPHRCIRIIQSSEFNSKFVATAGQVFGDIESVTRPRHFHRMCGCPQVRYPASSVPGSQRPCGYARKVARVAGVWTPTKSRFETWIGPALGLGTGAQGSRRLKHAPPLGMLLAVSVPPCASAIWRAICRPSPIPPVLGGEARSKRPKIRERSLSRRPGPLSRTSRTAARPSCAIDTSIEAPAAYLIAFDSRFVTICSTRRRSHVPITGVPA